tara:strand:- start:3072 stop:3695 length:624 start_codon:yes stop_codon:yes gene_type:complete
MNVYDANDSFEESLCNYTGSPYCVTVDNQSNALFLCLKYENIKGKTVSIPSHTYPSVPCSIIHAGGSVEFYKSNENLKGEYRLEGTNTWDSALRFTKRMYRKGMFQCLSFTGPHKHLKLGKGGAILTDSLDAYLWFKRARFSGRRELSYLDDNFDMLGWNFYMMPEIAIKGLRDMKQFYDKNGNAKSNKDVMLCYPDLSKFDVYKKQ